MPEVIEINDIDELAGYRLIWNRLLEDMPRATFFHTFEWLQTYWHHFGSDQALRVLVVQSGGQPIGIVPLCVRRERYRVGGVRVLTYPLDDWGTWYGPIGSNQAATMVLAMQHIRQTRRDWDMIDLRWNGPTGSDGGRPGRAMRIASLQPKKTAYQTSSAVDLNGNWNDYLATRPSKVRSELRRVLRRSTETDDVQYVRYRPTPARMGGSDPRWDLYDQCEQIAARSWQAQVADGNTLSTGRVRAFLRAAHQEAARLGMVDLNLLWVDGQPAAFAYNYCFGDRVFGLRTGFDPNLEVRGCGSALWVRWIYDSCQRGDRLLDLGAGDFGFKRRLRTRVESSYRLTHAPLASWRSQAVRLSQWAKRGLRRQETAGKATSA